jgi:anionic cell wall polymer biosynthesis LytR-Cps2A-Psr (LCP) family protein
MAKKGVKLGITYIITFIASLLIFGFVGGVYVNMLTGGGSSESEEDGGTVAETDEYLPSASDDRTIAAVVDYGDNGACFMLIRFLPGESEAVFLPLPADMVCDENSENSPDGSETTLLAAYRSASSAGVKTAIRDTLGVETDRYVVFDADSFGTFCDLFGGTTYNIPVEMTVDGNITVPAGETYLDRNIMRAVLTHPGYAKGEEERARRFGEIMTSMLNRNLTADFVPLLENAFATFINSGVDTDISRIDFEESYEPLVFSLSQTDRFCRQIISSGTRSDSGNYIVDTDFIEALHNWFMLE